MKAIKYIGGVIFGLALLIFILSAMLGPFTTNQQEVQALLSEKQFAQLDSYFQEELYDRDFQFGFQMAAVIRTGYENTNRWAKKEARWDDVLYERKMDLSSKIVRGANKSAVQEDKGLFLFLTFGLGIIGSLMWVLPNVILLGKKGIKNNHYFQQSSTNRGWIGWLVFACLVSFYILLYFFPDFITNWIIVTDPLSMALNRGAASQWFLYGFLYCVVMSVMGVRMFIKYRHNRYQMFRTSSVLFFQICFAFLIPEILVRFNQPYYDFKNIWPLDYDFFFQWNLDAMLSNGTLGLFMLVWGIVLILVGVPVMVYFFGKRWYCSWVCGCGGLAETLGDPYRHLSDKSVKSWKIERYLIHSVLVFALVMTGVTLYTFFSGDQEVLGVQTQDVQSTYGFMIGSVFAGVIGTGFYPVMGNRVWCRFGCPLAAYLGLVQRFKSRFRITTNGAQCISCGNCSTFCEMGIDVRWYAQRGQNIVRSSCVGCGVCSAVCPRGVLKLENGPEEGRINDNPILIGKKGIQLSKNVTS